MDGITSEIIDHAVDSIAGNGSSPQLEEGGKGDLFAHEEFFQDKDDAPISEAFICKKVLFATIGASNAKVFDVCSLFPPFFFLMFLIYTSPRWRQKMSGANTLQICIYSLIWTCAVATCIRPLLLIAAPTHHDSNNALEKVAWTLTRSILISLELTVVTDIMLSSSASVQLSRRIMSVITMVALSLFTVIVLIEMMAPSPAFHVFEFGYYLYGEGGGLLTACLASALSLLYALLLAVKCRQHKATPDRQKALLFGAIFLAVHALRALGGFLLALGIQNGICLTSATLFIETCLFAPLVFLLLLLPHLTQGLGHSLLAYTQQTDDWEQSEVRQYYDDLPGGIIRNENVESKILDSEDEEC